MRRLRSSTEGKKLPFLSFGILRSISPALVDNRRWRDPLRLVVLVRTRSWRSAPMASVASTSMRAWVEERDHLTHKITIGALCDSLSERGQVKIKVGHRSFFLSRLTRDTLRMLRWPDYFVDPPNDTTSGDVNHCHASDSRFQN